MSTWFRCFAAADGASWRGRVINLSSEVPMDGLDPRYQRLSRRAKEDAEYLLSLKVDPYSDRRRYSDIQFY